MKWFRHVLDPDLWSQLLFLLLPFIGIAALLLLAKPNTSEETWRRPHRLPTGSGPSIVIPQSLPDDFLPKLSGVTPKGLLEVIDEMALEEAIASSSYTTSPASPDVSRAQATARAKPATLTAEALPTPTFKSATLVDGLVSPDGIAIDSRTGNFFISEEEAHRIVMITPKGRVKTVIDQNTRLYVQDDKREKRIGPIRAPEGLSMDDFGRLYIVEDRPGGRIVSVQMSESGKVGVCEVIHVPGQTAPIAWEGIAARNNGELLLAGSTAESATGAGGAMSQGVLVYRDRDGKWWVPIMRPMASLSGIAFSRGGQYAIYSDEITGTLGWVDLQTRYLREGASQTTFRAPEGVAVLPDGRIVVAEEGGRVSVVDPATDVVMLIAEGLGQIESVFWDAHGERLLVTADGRGAVLELTPNTQIARGPDRMARAACMAEGAIRDVPVTPPEFLRPLLEMGGLSDLNPDFDLAFDELTRKVPMIATDARAILMPAYEDVPDPVIHVRFVALDPNRINFDEPGYNFALSAVILRTQSGQIFKTQLARTVILTGNMWLGKFKNHGSFDVPIPFAYSAQVGPRGHAVIHFTGLGRSPDIAIALNPENPKESYMVVTRIDGTLEQYRLQETHSADNTPNTVISMPPRLPQAWIDISQAPTDEASPARRLN